MRDLLVLVVACLSLSSTAPGATADRKECKAVKEKIRHVRSRMRAGYTRAQGERMEAQLRKLRRARHKACR